jgi:hypothetical protein
MEITVEVFTSILMEVTQGGMVEYIIPDSLRTPEPALNIAPILLAVGELMID